MWKHRTRRVAVATFGVMFALLRPAVADDDHWALKPVTRPEPPRAAANPVDAFIDARLAAAALEANPPTSAHMLVRRLSIVLTGLPPTYERIVAFERDFAARPGEAYESLVDELLASPQFGERWAQHWLDAIRWAETHGSESNAYRERAWVYRDYVVRAFNADVPYDRFVREQLAGDAMGAGDATGFLVSGPHVEPATVGREPPMIRQARADRVDEIIQTLGASVMGMTVGCARCHDHLFDPITMRDYYAIAAVFADVEFGSRKPELAPTHPLRDRPDVVDKPSFVGTFIQPAKAHVLLRGDPEQRGEAVDPGGLSAWKGDLGLTSQTPGQNRRVAFGQWLTAKDHPLTARVMVNRIWHHLFGEGIVSTPADLGRAGAAPSDPQLLDWLAAEFVEPTAKHGEAWSVKRMIRLIVTSEAFKRSGQPTKEGIAKDAGDRLLWRFPPRRVEAEVLRDSILMASGALDQTIGGEGFRIYGGKGQFAQWEVADNHGPKTWRRMLYQQRMRRVDDKLFSAFDFPDCGQVRGRRPTSTTPLQALSLMNSDFVVEQSRMIAQRAERAAQGEDAAATICQCFRLILGREPSADELAACRPVVDDAGLAVLCRTLLNSNEFAFLP